MDNIKNLFDNFTKIGEDKHPSSDNINNPASLNDRGVEKALNEDYDGALSDFILAIESKPKCMKQLSIIHRNKALVQLIFATFDILISINCSLDSKNFEEFTKNIQTMNDIIKLVFSEFK